MRPTLNVKPQLHEAAPVWKSPPDKSTSFYVRASRYRGLLHFVVCRVLGNSDRADVAVENSLFAAFRRVKTFACEGAFRSWLVRIAIDEALAILHRRSIREHRRDWSLQQQDSVGSLASAVEAIARGDLSDLADRLT